MLEIAEEAFAHFFMYLILILLFSPAFIRLFTENRMLAVAHHNEYLARNAINALKNIQQWPVRQAGDGKYIDPWIERLVRTGRLDEAREIAWERLRFTHEQELFKAEELYREYHQRLAGLAG